jgi:hypothetical protein
MNKDLDTILEIKTHYDTHGIYKIEKLKEIKTIIDKEFINKNKPIPSLR